MISRRAPQPSVVAVGFILFIRKEASMSFVRKPRVCPNLEILEQRCLPSVTLLQDTFQTGANPNGGGWNDVNHALASRQSGLLAPTPYVESIATGAGGAFDNLTQVNNPALPDTLRLANRTSTHQFFTFVSPQSDFGADGMSMQHLHVAVDPLGPGSSSAADHWAAVVFGAAPGSFVNSSGTGVLVRNTGGYGLFDDGHLVSTGNIGAKQSSDQFYTIDFTIDPANGHFTLDIDGRQIFTGRHGGGAYGSNFVTLENFTGGKEAGVQTDYFADLSVSGTARPQTVARPNTTYYVSPTGSDSNSGTSPTQAWQTINHVDQVTFQPGDQILFQGGAMFVGNLAFDSRDVGPITVGSYGNGRATLDAGDQTGILVTDAGRFTIVDLNLVGSGFTTNVGDGISFISNLPGVAETGITVSNVSVSGFGQIGVSFLGTDGSRDFSNVSVTYVTADNNGAGGVQVLAQGNAHTIYIGHVQANHNAGTASSDSGFGILVFGATDVVIERSTTGDNGWLPGNLGETGGIEAIDDNRVLLQYNEAYSNHRGASDGDGVILDTTTDSIMQFNYTHDNDGGGLFLFAEAGSVSNGNVIRYNISQDDARNMQDFYGGIAIGLDVNNADIYNNTIFVDPSPNSSPSGIRMAGLSGVSIHVRNNIFMTTGGVPVVSWDGTGTDVVFQGNDYWSGTSPLTILSNGVTYKSLAAWRAATGEEMLGSEPIGLHVNPGLTHAGGGGTIGNADRLFTLAAYQLLPGSRLTRAGLDLAAFGVAWDPYHMADDPFLGRFFNATPTDFYENLLASPGSNLFSIGADQA
jgi:hypothetical protein